MRTTTYSPDGKVRCPYCNSVQVKAARNQPKKYPKPKTSWLFVASKEDVNRHADFWQNGYDCKKCGNEFILQTTPQSTPSVKSNSIPSITTAAKTKKKGGFLWKLAFWVLLIFAGLVAYGVYDKQHNPKHSKSASFETSQNKKDTLKITETRTTKDN